MELYAVFAKDDPAHVYGRLVCHLMESRPAIFHNLEQAEDWKDEMQRSYPLSDYYVFKFSIEPTIKSEQVI